MSFEQFFTPYDVVETLPGKVVAVLAPHPDDEVFGCGGLLHTLSNMGVQVRVAVISDGAAQNGEKDSADKHRQEESVRAAGLLGYPEPEFWDLPDGQLLGQQDLDDRIGNWLAEVQPELVLAPSIWEMHRDHRAVAVSALNSMERLPDAATLAMYEVGVPLTPNVLVDISSALEAKEAAMACFVSQLEVQSYDEHIRGLNKYRTYTLSKDVKGAEAYHLLTRQEAMEFCHEQNPEQHNLVLVEAEKKLETACVEQAFFQGELINAQGELIGSQKNLINAQGDLVAAREELSDVEAQFKKAQDGLDKTELDLKTALEGVSSLEKELEAAERELEAFGKELEVSKSEVAELNTHLGNVFASTSWRLTSPLRMFVGTLKGERSVRATCSALLRATWYKLPLPRGIKGRLRSLPGNIQRRVFRSVDTAANRAAAGHLIDHRAAFIDNVKSLDKQEPVMLDISVVTYNSEKLLTAFVESLAAQSYPLEKINLRFVDNDSKDNTLQALYRLSDEFKGRFGAFEILERPNNGFGAGHNAGIDAGIAPFVLVVNPDIEFEADSLTNLVFTALQDDESVACWEARQKPYEHPKLYDPVTLEVNWCSHACVLLRRSAMQKIDGYDERIFLYGEDVEVSYRLREAGYTLRYVPSATVWHYTYESAGQVKPAQYVGSIIGNIYLRTRYGTLKDLLFVAPLMVAILMQSPFKGSRRKLLKDFVSRYLRYLPQLLCERKSLESCAFPFRLLDYEQQREGAFWEAKQRAVAVEELPLVSIVTRTVAGRDQLLKQAGLTVLNQTYPNIEWVVVEDGGEAQRPIVESLMDGRDGVKVTYEGLEKVGRSAAGNRGMEIASGQWLMFLDDDDCLYADHVETLMDELLGDDEAAAAYSLAWEVESIVKDGGRDIREASYHQVASLRQPFDYQKLRQCNYIPIQAIIFKANLYKDRGGFDTDLDYLEDWHIWQRYAHNNRFVYVPKTTSMYRTPMDSGERARRQQLLDDAYLDVKARSNEAISALDA